MAYYEWQCFDCSTVFEYGDDIVSHEKPKCVDCESQNLLLIGFSAEKPSALQSLINEVAKLGRRIENITTELGISEVDIAIKKENRREH